MKNVYLRIHELLQNQIPLATGFCYPQNRSSIIGSPSPYHQHTLSGYLLWIRLWVRWFERNTRYLEPEPQIIIIVRWF